MDCNEYGMVWRMHCDATSSSVIQLGYSLGSIGLWLIAMFTVSYLLSVYNPN